MGNMSSKNTIFDSSYQGLKATAGAAHVMPNMASQVKQGNVYSIYIDNAAGGAGTFSKMLIQNPASSGIYVAITRIMVKANATLEMEWGFYNTVLSTSPITAHSPLNRLSSGAANTAVTSTEVTATNLLASTTPGGYLRIAATGEGIFTHDFMYPPLVDENDGFLLQDITTNANTDVIIEWVEITK